MTDTITETDQTDNSIDVDDFEEYDAPEGGAQADDSDETVADVQDAEPAPRPAPEKGSWQAALDRSGKLQVKSAKDKKKAGELLWAGAQEGIDQWLDGPATGSDESGQALADEVQDLLGGKSRKGDASKVKTVALAARDNDLTLGNFDSLSKAYAEAVRLTKTVAAEKVEDSAIETAIESIEAPKSTGTLEGAAQLLLSKGVDEAARHLLDVLNTGEVDADGDKVQNNEAHRALVRAIQAEVVGRVKAPVKKTPAAGDAADQNSGTPKAARKTGRKTGPSLVPTGVAKTGRAKTKAAPKKAEPTLPAEIPGPSDDEADRGASGRTGGAAPTKKATPKVPARRGRPVSRKA